jgi:hypothetical protein
MININREEILKVSPEEIVNIDMKEFLLFMVNTIDDIKFDREYNSGIIKFKGFTIDNCNGVVIAKGLDDFMVRVFILYTQKRKEQINEINNAIH